MALVFQRIARNLAKNGFFPTDDETIRRTLTAIQPTDESCTMRVLDPCCGEGIAVRAVQQHLGSGAISFGIEYDQARAAAARGLVDHVLWADFQDTVVEQGGFSCLWLNPPYGLMASDRAQTGDESINRFEELFFRRSVPALAMGGLLVLIVPIYELRGQLARWIAKSFEQVTVHLAADDTFKQVVLLGIRRRAVQSGYERIAERLCAIGEGREACQPLPSSWIDVPYLVPASRPLQDLRFGTVSLDPLQVLAVRQGNPTLWQTFRSYLGAARSSATPPPLRQAGDWHLALLLAAGEVNGLVHAAGDTLLIKGNTVKDVQSVKSVEFDTDGNVKAEIDTRTERFVASIKAINLTEGPRYGDVFDIR